MKTYSVKEIFLTIQGEGLNAGRRAVFIRFTGCNLWNGTEAGRETAKGACGKWCDTDFKKDGAKQMTVKEICDEAFVAMANKPIGKPLVVVTGGEPFLQFDRELLTGLRDELDATVAVETNGTVEPTCLPDHITVSPKLLSTGKMAELKINGASELKVVLGARAGIDWTDQQLKMFDDRSLGVWGAKFVQPCDAGVMLGRFRLNGPIVSSGTMKRCVEWVIDHPGWRLGVQMHKLVGVP